MERLTLPDNPSLEVLVRRNARARRLTLRVSRSDGRVTLTLPPRVPLRQGRSFVEERAGWIAAQLAARPETLVVEEGLLLPYLGGELRVVRAAVRTPRHLGDELHLPKRGHAGRLARLWLRERARTLLTEASTRHADTLGLAYARITLRDTRSRWGSCSHDGKLMYSWRLAMAPPEVLDYVAAHEVAHLAHMDHSPAYWAVCARLCPEWTRHRRWLRDHGAELMRVDFEAEVGD